jgi:hypothetical protein
MENHHIRTVGCLYARCISSIEARSGAKPLGLFTNAIPHLHQKLCMSASHLGTSTKLFTRTIVDAVEEPVVSAQYSMFQPAIQHLGRDSYFLLKRTNWPLLREPYQTVLPMCNLPHRETRIRTGLSAYFRDRDNIYSLMLPAVTGLVVGRLYTTMTRHVQATTIAFTGHPALPRLYRLS